jgi:hypothetical protein
MSPNQALLKLINAASVPNSCPIFASSVSKIGLPADLGRFPFAFDRPQESIGFSTILPIPGACLALCLPAVVLMRAGLLAVENRGRDGAGLSGGGCSGYWGN